MPKTKEPRLSDWHAVLSAGDYSDSLTIRASSLMVVEGSYVLRDTYGGILFAAPAAAFRYVRRLEPGVKGALAAEAPGQFAPIEPVPGDAHVVIPEPGAAQVNAPIEPLNPAAEKAVPATARSRSTKRGR